MESTWNVVRDLLDATLANESPSSFQSSCPGGRMLTSSKNIDENSNCTSKKSKSSGGFTCCVPGCFNNNKRSPELSFYNFPNGKSKESVELRKKWIRLISRVNFTPTIGHRVCSEHFSGGKKTYTNNLPTIVPSSQVTKPAKPCNPRPTVKARNRTFVSKQNNANGTTPQSRRRLFSEIEEDANSNLENIDPNDPETMPAAGKQTVEESSVLEEKIALLTKENKRLQAENCNVVKSRYVRYKYQRETTCKNIGLFIEG